MRRPLLVIATCVIGSLCGCDRKRAVPATDVYDPARAAVLAAAHCSSCHVYPEPRELELEGWRTRVLPRMRLLLGLDRPDPRQMHNPELASHTNIFPNHPRLSEADWRQIAAFYLQNAPETQPRLARDTIPANLTQFELARLPFSLPVPTTTFVQVKKPGTILFADARTETIYTLNARGELQTSVVVSNIVTSVRQFGSERILAGIGDFFPSDDPFGEVILLNPAPVSLLTDLPRVTHVEPADLNGDGRLDFALSVFGNLMGRFSWFEARVDRSFREHVLFAKPGALKSVAYDLNADGLQDLAVLIAQETESLIVYLNAGDGMFREQLAFRRSPTFGHTDFELGDVDGDGKIDLIVSNGDNADFHTQPRPYHGIRIYRNDGETFREAYFFPFHGAYNVEVADFDGDGDLDIAAVAFFANYASPNPESFVLLENQGVMRFTARTLPGLDIGRWLTMHAGDVDGDGDIDLVLGAMAEMPDPTPRHWRQRWAKESPSVLLLKNRTR